MNREKAMSLEFMRQELHASKVAEVNTLRVSILFSLLVDNEF